MEKCSLFYTSVCQLAFAHTHQCPERTWGKRGFEIIPNVRLGSSTPRRRGSKIPSSIEFPPPWPLVLRGFCEYRSRNFRCFLPRVSVKAACWRAPLACLEQLREAASCCEYGRGRTSSDAVGPASIDNPCSEVPRRAPQFVRGAGPCDPWELFPPVRSVHRTSCQKVHIRQNSRGACVSRDPA